MIEKNNSVAMNPVQDLYLFLILCDLPWQNLIKDCYFYLASFSSPARLIPGELILSSVSVFVLKAGVVLVIMS